MENRQWTLEAREVTAAPSSSLYLVAFSFMLRLLVEHGVEKGQLAVDGKHLNGSWCPLQVGRGDCRGN